MLICLSLSSLRLYILLGNFRYRIILWTDIVNPIALWLLGFCIIPSIQPDDHGLVIQRQSKAFICRLYACLSKLSASIGINSRQHLKSLVFLGLCLCRVFLHRVIVKAPNLLKNLALVIDFRLDNAPLDFNVLLYAVFNSGNLHILDNSKHLSARWDWQNIATAFNLEAGSVGNGAFTRRCIPE